MKVYFEDDCESFTRYKVYSVEESALHLFVVSDPGVKKDLKDGWAYKEYIGPVPAGFILLPYKKKLERDDVEYFTHEATGRYLAYRIVEEKEVEVTQEEKDMLAVPQIAIDSSGVSISIELPQSLVRLAINELMVDIEKYLKASQYGDAIEVATMARNDRWAIDDSHVSDLSEYLQSIAD